ncbi:pyridoxal biosynthesis lyase PdxS [Arthrobacter ginsengisoli]|uniref:pyridoxal 5'-phosphate synthase (glutamine hydrolyzing) n=1 Tax=Arthrobacter ginsengisoli TaxID=1356565 RepID=A0ABU1U7J2_9MICC|nr:pyridoxal biosynthesis lyase PdxS [Arthrobacter ginsengisoli]
MIEKIIDSVPIPVMAKARIGHFVEAQVLQSLGVDYIDESEVLTPADYINHVDKWNFTSPFVSGAINLGEALRRINKGAAMIRSKGEAGTDDVSNATGHMRKIRSEIAKRSSLPEDELYVAAKELQAPYELVKEVVAAGKLPGYSRWHRHPSRRGHDDAARCRRRVPQLRHLRVRQPRPAAAVVKATTFYNDPTSSPRPPAAWAKPWWASTSTRSPSPTGPPNGAGDFR